MTDHESVDFEVELALGGTVAVPAHLAPDGFGAYVPKRLHHWPDGLVEAITTRFAANMHLPVEAVESGILQIRPAGDEDLSTP